MKRFWRVAATVLALCLSFGAVGTLASCDKAETPPPAPNPQTGSVAVSVKNEKGVALADIDLVVYDQTTDAKAAELTTDADGKASVTLELGKYEAELDREALPDRHYFINNDNVFEFEVKADEENELNIVIGYLEEVVYDGTSGNPFALAAFFGEESDEAELTLPAQAEYYYTTTNVAGYELWIFDSRVSVTYEQQTYTYNAAVGAVIVPLPLTAATDRVKFAVKNTADEEIVVTARWEAAKGAENNPFELVTLTNVETEVTGGDAVYYKWTATAAGTLSVTAITPDFLNEETPYGVISLKVQGTVTEETESLAVAAGDVVLVIVNMRGTLTADAKYEITFDLAFAESNE